MPLMEVFPYKIRTVDEQTKSSIHNVGTRSIYVSNFCNISEYLPSNLHNEGNAPEYVHYYCILSKIASGSK
jgi:hypothetical protein